MAATAVVTDALLVPLDAGHPALAVLATTLLARMTVVTATAITTVSAVTLATALVPRIVGR